MKKYLLSIICTLLPIFASAQEPYAVLNEDNTVLTFYYDSDKSSRDGMGVGPFTFSKETSKDDRGWYDTKGSITTVVFDNSFDSYMPKSTAFWFYKCDNLKEIKGFNNLHTDSVTNMYEMFAHCSSYKELDLSHFNTAKVTNMFGMFAGCTLLSAINISSFNTANVTDMSNMFSECKSLKDIELSHFDTSNVVNMNYMFYRCTSLENLDLSNFVSTNLHDMIGMFLECTSLVTVDVSGFDFSFSDNISTNTGEMFAECKSLTTIWASTDWNSSSRLSGDYAYFSHCYSLVGGNGTKFDSGYTNRDYACIDRPDQPGYFTEKEITGIKMVSHKQLCDECYSLDGKIINGKPSKKGIYISQGKKIVIK